MPRRPPSRPRPVRRRWTDEYFLYMYRASKENPVFYGIEHFLGEEKIVEWVHPILEAGFFGVRYEQHDGIQWRKVE